MTKLALSLITAGVLTLAMADTSAQTSSSTNTQMKNDQVQVQTQASASVDIATQIKKLQNADAKQRVELMNQLKERIATMSPDARRETMQQLHLQMRSHAGNKHAKDQEMMKKVQEMLGKMQGHKMQMQEGSHGMNAHVEMMQQNAHHQMERNEHMNQKEAGEQFKEHIGGHLQNHMRGDFANKTQWHEHKEPQGIPQEPKMQPQGENQRQPHGGGENFFQKNGQVPMGERR